MIILYKNINTYLHTGPSLEFAKVALKNITSHGVQKISISKFNLYVSLKYLCQIDFKLTNFKRIVHLSEEAEKCM